MVQLLWRGARPALIAATLAGGLAGCSSYDPPPPITDSMTKATVSGKVIVDGRPISKGEILFDPANINRRSAPSTTAKIEGGSYKIETLVGPNSIRISSAELKRQVGSDFDVKEGSNTHDIDIKSGTGGR
ncbi:hypothetical protein TA3x_003966 [Tundrisphaera sp. TA3]|uniref:hypothetical protein n=1 Tax=Tundrisphaera sp. TA3 TaxID=3435775 RepID=UPI003EB9C55D